MATYTDLADIQENASYGALVQKIRVAAVIKAVALLDAATPTSAEVAWALSALDSPASAAESVSWYVIGANNSATVAQIVGASDAAVQTNVNAAVDKIVSV